MQIFKFWIFLSFCIFQAVFWPCSRLYFGLKIFTIFFDPWRINKKIFEPIGRYWRRQTICALDVSCWKDQRSTKLSFFWGTLYVFVFFSVFLHIYVCVLFLYLYFFGFTFVGKSYQTFWWSPSVSLQRGLWTGLCICKQLQSSQSLWPIFDWNMFICVSFEFCICIY